MSIHKNTLAKKKNIVAGVCYHLGKEFDMNPWIFRGLFIFFLFHIPVVTGIVYFGLMLFKKNTTLMSRTISTCSGDIIDEDLAPKIMTFAVIIISLQVTALALIS